MKNDNIELGGKKYRIEFNWNAISVWMDITGKSIDHLVDMKDVRGSELTELCYQSVVEGCRRDGVEFPYSKLDFGAELNPKTIGDLMKVLERHMQSRTSIVNPKKK